MTILRVSIESAPVTKIMRFDSFPIRIGRAETCEFKLYFEFVSNVHVQLNVAPGRILIRDEGSRLGTHLNGTLAPKKNGSILVHTMGAS